MARGRRPLNTNARRLMRALATVLPLCASAPAKAAGAQVIVVRNGHEVVVPDGATWAAKLVALAESCSVDSSAHAAPTQSWAATAASRSGLRVAFPVPRTALLAQGANGIRSAQPVREIRLSLPHGDWPRHVLVSTGTGIVSLTKCDPLVLGELAMLPELGLTAVAPYNSLVPLKPRR